MGCINGEAQGHMNNIGGMEYREVNLSRAEIEENVVVLTPTLLYTHSSVPSLGNHHRLMTPI